jgi:hypothetical protein
MAHKSKFVEDKINELLEAQHRDKKKPQKSPMIHQMLSLKTDKVQKLKKVFEERDHDEEEVEEDLSIINEKG